MAKEAETSFKYGVPELAAKLGVNETTTRVKLRNADVAKAGKSYGWNKDADFQAVVKQLKSETAAPAAAKKAPAKAVAKPKKKAA